MSTPGSRLSRRAGALLREALEAEIAAAGGGPAGIEIKPSAIGGDLVTRVDHGVEARLMEALPRLLPGSAVLGEEAYDPATARAVAGSGQPLWLLDPLDGTLNFASGLPIWGASLALVEHGRPLLGLVYDPSADALYGAEAGQGAWVSTRNAPEQTLKWSAERAVRAPVAISSGFLMRREADPATFAPDWLGRRFRILGGQALQLCWAAEGRLRLTLNAEARIWDDAAGALICTEAGAGYAALAPGGLYPLDPGGAALAGGEIFSVAGDPALGDQAIEAFGAAVQKGQT